MINGALGLPAEDVRAVLEAGCRAPSVHNSQPWRFRIEPDRIDLLPDLARRIPVADRDDRELRISCGAALFNIRMALAHRRVAPEIAVHPDDRLGFTVTIRNGGSAAPSAEDATLHMAIRRRRTNRRPFLDQPVDADERHGLIRAAEAEHCRLKVVDDPADQARLHALLVRAHNSQLADPAWAAEFASWAGRAPDDREGVAVPSSGPRPEPQDIWVLRDFALGQSPSRLPGKDFESQPLIAVVATYFDDAFAQVQAGQAMQRVLLAATAGGLSASFLSQVIEVDDARIELRQLLGGSVFPQVVLRIGHGSPVPAVPRRPIEECLDTGQDADLVH